MEIKKIKISQIDFMASSLRLHDKEEDHIVELANDIRDRGLLNMPTVVDKGNGKFVPTDGARRWTALMLLADRNECPLYEEVVGEINMQVKPDQSDLETLADQIAGNATVKSTANKEYIDGLYKLASQGNFSMDQLAKKAGKSANWIAKLFKTKKIPDAVWEKCEAGKVPMANMITMADIIGKVEGEELEAIVKAAITQPAEEFAITVDDELSVLRELRKESRGGGSAEFSAKEKFIGKDGARLMLAQAENDFIEDSSEVNEAILNVLKKLFSLDEASIAAQKEAFDKKIEDKKAQAEARKKEREDAKLEEEADKLAAAGFTVAKADGEEIDPEAAKQRLAEKEAEAAKKKAEAKAKAESEKTESEDSDESEDTIEGA